MLVSTFFLMMHCEASYLYHAASRTPSPQAASLAASSLWAAPPPVDIPSEQKQNLLLLGTSTWSYSSVWALCTEEAFGQVQLLNGRVSWRPLHTWAVGWLHLLYTARHQLHNHKTNCLWLLGLQ